MTHSHGPFFLHIYFYCKQAHVEKLKSKITADQRIVDQNINMLSVQLDAKISRYNFEKWFTICRIKITKS